MGRRTQVFDLGVRREWTPLQAAALRAETRVLCLDGGRRWGKTWTATEVVRRRIHRRHDEYAARVRRGEAKPWSGLGLPPRLARHEMPCISVVVLTPREFHQEQCRSYLLGGYAGAARVLLHPKLALADAGREVWLCYAGVATRIRYVTGSGATAVVSQAHDLIHVDEAGLLDGSIIEAALPTLWERRGELVLSGTPALGVEHWYTQRCLSGLDPGHPYYVPDVVERDPDCTTIIGSSYEAYLPEVRRQARADAERLGKAWEAQWVLGDWRIPDLFVFGEWNPAVHVVPYDPYTRRLGGRTLPPPTRVLGVVDWAYSATSPGAAVVYHVWLRNPLDRHDQTRPLVIAVEDHQEALSYTDDGWWRVMADLRHRYGVQMWYADPSRDELVQAARYRSAHHGPVKPASKRDKMGRLQLVGALLHYRPRGAAGPSDEGMDPALLVTQECKHLIRQFARYRWKQDSKGNPRDVPVDYDDHAIDCTAFLMGMIMTGGLRVPGLVL